MKENSVQKWIKWIFNIDRKVVYLFMLLAVSLPFFLKPVVKMKTTKWVEASYQLIEEAAEKNKPIMISFDFDPSTLAELQPMAIGLLRHAFSKNVKVFGISFIIQGTALAADMMDTVAKEYNKEYGIDYVMMPYMISPDLVIISMGTDIRSSYTKDYRGTDINKIKIFEGIQNFNDFQMVASISGTSMPKWFVVYGVTKFKFNFIAGVTAVSATEYYTYLQTGQMKGFLAGMKAAAEYESLIKISGDAMRGMASQSWGHLTIIFFIIFGNILFYLKKWFDKKEEQEERGAK